MALSLAAFSVATGNPISRDAVHGVCSERQEAVFCPWRLWLRGCGGVLLAVAIWVSLSLGVLLAVLARCSRARPHCGPAISVLQNRCYWLLIPTRD